MDPQDDLRIQVRLNSTYRVLDLSSNLPFSLVFGLCRRAPLNTDPRTLLIQKSSSVFDLPYALSTGLLKLQEGKERREVDLKGLGFEAFLGVHAGNEEEGKRR